MKNTIKQIQRALGVEADGIMGPVTLAAVARAVGVQTAAHEWPTQAEVRRGKSVFGTAGNEAVLASIIPPYPLYFEGKQVRTIRVHERIAGAVAAALSEVLEHYGLEEIHRLHLDVYGGSYANRATTGGNSKSMHAWGVALDFDPEHNAMNMHAPEAAFSGPEYEAWWQIWERHGAVSMGRTYDKDWMHIQFARF